MVPDFVPGTMATLDSQHSYADPNGHQHHQEAQHGVFGGFQQQQQHIFPPPPPRFRTQHQHGYGQYEEPSPPYTAESYGSAHSNASEPQHYDFSAIKRRRVKTVSNVYAAQMQHGAHESMVQRASGASSALANTLAAATSGRMALPKVLGQQRQQHMGQQRQQHVRQQQHQHVGQQRQQHVGRGAGVAATKVKQKRVRTGCLTCRDRHLKCDERMPECVNCRKSSRECRRGVRVTFQPADVKSPPFLLPPAEEWRVEFLDESKNIASEWEGGLERYALYECLRDPTPPAESNVEAALRQGRQEPPKKRHSRRASRHAPQNDAGTMAGGAMMADEEASSNGVDDRSGFAQQRQQQPNAHLPFPPAHVHGPAMGPESMGPAMKKNEAFLLTMHPDPHMINNGFSLTNKASRLKAMPLLAQVHDPQLCFRDVGGTAMSARSDGHALGEMAGQQQGETQDGTPPRQVKDPLAPVGQREAVMGKKNHLVRDVEIRLMQAFVQEVAIWMDAMDSKQHFQRIVPFLALQSHMLKNAVFACGAKHLTLVAEWGTDHAGHANDHHRPQQQRPRHQQQLPFPPQNDDQSQGRLAPVQHIHASPSYISPSNANCKACQFDQFAVGYYDTATTALQLSLKNPDRNMAETAATAVVLNVYETMSEKPLERMNHVAGARALIRECGWDARSGGIGSACFWVNMGIEVLSDLAFNWHTAWDPDLWGLDMAWADGLDAWDIGPGGGAALRTRPGIVDAGSAASATDSRCSSVGAQMGGESPSNLSFFGSAWDDNVDTNDMRRVLDPKDVVVPARQGQKRSAATLGQQQQRPPRPSDDQTLEPEVWVHRIFYIVAKICDFRANTPQFQEACPHDQQLRTQKRYAEWRRLRNLTDMWGEKCSRPLSPLGYSDDGDERQSSSTSLFPNIWLVLRTAVIGRLFFHTANILLAQYNPIEGRNSDYNRGLQLHHARQVCGIIAHTADRGVASVAIRSLTIASGVLRARDEQVEVLDLLARISRDTGWHLDKVRENLTRAWAWPGHSGASKKPTEAGQIRRDSVAASTSTSISTSANIIHKDGQGRALAPPSRPTFATGPGGGGRGFGDLAAAAAAKQQEQRQTMLRGSSLRNGPLPVNPLLATADFGHTSHPYKSWYLPPGRSDVSFQNPVRWLS